jgi:hypothetical protein
MPTVTETTAPRQAAAGELLAEARANQARAEAAPEFWPLELDESDPNDWPAWTDEDCWELSDAPADVEARIAAEARELATPGMPAAPHAVALFRNAYRSLWARLVACC